MAIETCPGCSGALGVGSREGVYACPGCKGRYVDRFALKKLGVAVPAELSRNLPRHPRRCAGCGSEMEQVVISKVTLDHCGSCESIFFDAGELQALRSAPREELLECDGCGRATPVSALESRDGKAMCPDCVADAPRLRGTGISDRDYLAAKRHASEDRVATVAVNSGDTSAAWNEGPDTGSSLLDALCFLFR